MEEITIHGNRCVYYNGKYYYEDRDLKESFIKKREEINQGKHRNLHTLIDDQKYDCFLTKYNLSKTTARETFLRMFQFENLRKEFKYLQDELRQKFGSKIVDHVNLFYHKMSKSYVFTSQPYDCCTDDYEKFSTFCRSRDPETAISISESWYYPGATPLIVVCKANVMPLIFREFNGNVN